MAARGLTDELDRLLTADAPLAQLQEACGGSLPGSLAIPELLTLVQRGRELGLAISREFTAYDGTDMVSGIARIQPVRSGDGGGCEIIVENWQRAPAEPASSRSIAERLDAIDRASAEVTARLDANQKMQFLNSDARDTIDLQSIATAEPGKIWTNYVELIGIAHQQPLHWRLLDGVECAIPGSSRNWRVRLLPIGSAIEGPRGFDLLFVADEPLVDEGPDKEPVGEHTRLIGSALTPVLRKPVARIIANAETIRAKLAGPLRAEYSDYAGNIAAAGQHLAGMLDDLADLEVVEAASFTTIEEKVDLVDAANRAAGILGVRAQARAIKLDLPKDGQEISALAEFRRVLQILINLIGNAIAYSPEATTVTIAVARNKGGTVSVSVADEGPGVSAEQAAKIFNKFERLDRENESGIETGSGLGLYISHRLASAMKGLLDLKSREGEGARFTLTLPAYKG